MDNALARHVALSGYRSKQGLRDLLELVQNHCEPAECESFGAAVAAVDQKIQSLFDTIFANHAGLKADIDDKAQRYGKPI